VTTAAATATPAALEQAAALMALMRELEGLMGAENALLRDMRLERLRGLQDEKAALAAAYEAELRRLRAAPEIAGALAPEARLALEEGMRRFRAAARANAQRLVAARGVVEGVVKALGSSLSASRNAGGYRPGGTPAAGGVGRGAGGQVVPLALNRRV
jgi:hypothetical protein